MRFAATLFSHATSQGPLALLVEAFIRYICRTLGLYGGGYVDDLVMAYKGCVALFLRGFGALLRGVQQLLASSTVSGKGDTRPSR